MDSKKISWADRVKELFPDEVVELPKGAAWCNDCKSTGLVRSYGNTLLQCNKCGGRGYILPCSECGEKPKDSWHSVCLDCKKKLDKQRKEEQFNKAEKIKYEDYDGEFFVSDYSEEVMDEDSFEEMLWELLEEGRELPKYVFAPSIDTPLLGRDLYDFVDSLCEDGYEEMYEHLDTKSLNPINEHFKSWVKDQGSNGNVYWDGTKTVILLDDLIKKLQKEFDEKV
jgi:hypothetical protein